MSYRFLLLLIVSFLTSSCDPPHYITFENQTDDEIKIYLMLSDDKEYFNTSNLITNDTLTIVVPKNESYQLDFGIGNWHDDEVRFIANTMKQMSFSTKHWDKTFKSKESIYQLMQTNVCGIFFKNEIKIEIHECCFHTINAINF